MTNARGGRPPIWEASRRPMFVKSVWLDNQGYRHIILDGGASKKRTNCPTRRENIKDIAEESQLSEQNPLELVGSSDILTISQPIKETNLARGQHKLCKKLFKSRYSVEVLRKHLAGNVRGAQQDLGGRQGGGKGGEDIGTSGGNLRDSEVILISEQSKNQLTERVLQWLDLAGKTTLVRPESEIPKGTAAATVAPRRIYTAEVNRKGQGLPCLKRTESVHHLSITLNEEDSGEASRSDASVTPRIKFGDFFPVTYRCSRKFLSHSSYRSRLHSPPTYMNTPIGSQGATTPMAKTKASAMGNSAKKTIPEHARDKNRKQFPSTVTSSSTGGKLGKSDSIENQYRGIIHRQLLETSCNTQIAKRQLHIFMPNLPNKSTKGDCDSCLSTVVSSDLSKKSHHS